MEIIAILMMIGLGAFAWCSLVVASDADKWKDQEEDPGDNQEQ
jgi:hypothetical protein